MKNIFKYILLFVLPVIIPVTVKAQSAIGQLEEITGTRIDRGGYGNGSYEVPSAPMPDQTYYNGEFSDFLVEQAYKENEKGIEYYNNQEWSKAAGHFRKARKFNPNDEAIKTNLDNCLNQMEIIKENKLNDEKYKKIDKAFLTGLNNDIKTYNTQLDRLRRNIRGIVPPLPDNRKTIKDGVMLGLFNTQKNNQIESMRLRNPFSGEPVKEDEFFATTDDDSWLELFRGFMDNQFLGRYTLNTAYGKKLVAELDGTHFNRLIAHSNGATVSEALIREGVIEVDELNVIGGDRSLINYNGYSDLVNSGKVKKVIVWVNPGDIIPLGSSAINLTPETKDRDEYQKDLTSFINYKLTGPGRVNPNVEYRYLQGDQYLMGQEYNFSKEHFWDAHGLFAYFENIKKYNSKK
jgi:hypothetical protein